MFKLFKALKKKHVAKVAFAAILWREHVLI